ncbi:unnamed protein product [Amoebophrya sp. A25]|nr:unnamed protein product [Amoebophrya sp. A25]|eukprot:GSA25T00010894001.1
MKKKRGAMMKNRRVCAFIAQAAVIAQRDGINDHLRNALTRLAFDPSVPDFAAGSEVDYKGDEEYMRVCMWTFRQLAEVCSHEGECEIGSIMAHTLQDDLRKFYRHGPYESLLSEDDAQKLQQESSRCTNCDRNRSCSKEGRRPDSDSDDTTSLALSVDESVDGRASDSGLATKTGDDPTEIEQEDSRDGIDVSALDVTSTTGCRSSATDEEATADNSSTESRSTILSSATPSTAETTRQGEMMPAGAAPAHFYRGGRWTAGRNRLTVPPVAPIESCAWIILGTDRRQRESEEDSCPGLTITCLLLMAEVFVLNSPDHFSVMFASEAEDNLHRLRAEKTAEEYAAIHVMWPISKAFTQYGLEYAHTRNVQYSVYTRRNRSLLPQISKIEDAAPIDPSMPTSKVDLVSNDLSSSDGADGEIDGVKAESTDADHATGTQSTEDAIEQHQEDAIGQHQDDYGGQLRLDVVVARCDAPMMWLWEFAFPPRTRMFVYEKCRHRGTSLQMLQDQLEGLEDHVEVFVRDLPERNPSFMSGECTAYLSYILEIFFQIHHFQKDEAVASSSDSSASSVETRLRDYQEKRRTILSSPRTSTDASLDVSVDLPDYVAFIHDDGPRHLRPAFFNVVLQSVAKATYEVPFLHLTHERYAALVTPCFERVFQLIFGEPLLAPVTSYCCSNFVVSRERILARSREFYENLADLIFHGRYTQLAADIRKNRTTTIAVHDSMKNKAGENSTWTAQQDEAYGHEDDLPAEWSICNVGKKPCYVMEYLWHVVFGEDLELAYREEDARLPLALRYGGGRQTQLPSALKLSPYTMAITPKRFTNKLRRLTAEQQD